MQITNWLSQSIEPAAVVDLGRDGWQSDLLTAYCDKHVSSGHDQRRVLRSVLSTATRSGARTAVIERRYTDIDYRDEHGRFYSQTFRQYPGTTHRLHFFAEDPPATVHSPDTAAVFDGMTYLGYTVLRPVPGAAVGRTMLAPPPGISSAVTCKAIDFVNFFGKTYRVEAAPFIAQDSQLGVCAHAAVWMIAYFHHLRYGGSRVLPGDIVDAVPTALTVGRSLPTPGLVLQQISDALEAHDVPPIVYWMHEPGLGRRDVDRIARRYLDSALPVIVGTRNHVYTLIGYKADQRGVATYICHDDEVGPYQTRRPLTFLPSDPWRYLIAPVPSQVYIPCGAAEQLGMSRIEQQLKDAVEVDAGDVVAKACNDLLDRITWSSTRDGAYRFFTSAIRSNDFKNSLIDRGYPEEIARSYMRIPMSKWIWVVELADSHAFREGRPSVVAEAIIDSTEHARDRHVLAWRVPGQVLHWDTDTDEIGRIDLRAILPESPVDHLKAESICATSRARHLEIK